MTNSSGCWLDASIGVPKESNPAVSTVDYEHWLWLDWGFSGGACWGDSVKYQQHYWLNVGLWAEDETWDSPAWNRAPFLNADTYANGWHTLKIYVDGDRIVRFYIDNNLIWTSTKKLHPSLMTSHNVELFGRSSGSAGKSYYDWVKVTTY